MKARRLRWLLAAAVVLSMSSSAAAGDVKSVVSSDFQLQIVSISVTQPTPTQQVVPLTSESPVTGNCTGSFNATIGGRNVEVCPVTYTIDVPADAEVLWIELEKRAVRDMIWAACFETSFARCSRVLIPRRITDPPRFSSEIAFLERPDLQTGTWAIGVFNFENRAQEYTLVASTSPRPLTSAIPWDGSILESTAGGRFQPGGCLLGLVDYTVEVPSGAPGLTIELRNKGSGNIELYARFGQAVEVSEGRIVADYASESPRGTETITITPTSSPPLRAGTYFIAVGNCENARQLFTLTATVGAAAQPPTIGLSPSSFSFSAQVGGSNPSSQTLNITNTGGGTLNWNATTSVPWLTVSPTSGTAPSSVTVSVNIAGLPAGTHQGQITVTAPGATNSPQTVPVTLTLTQPPQPPLIQVTPGSLSFSAVQGGANPAAQTLTISNTGGGTLNWTASANVPWLSISPTSGSAPPPSSATVSVNIAGLPVGRHSGLITITAPGATNSPLTVPVTLTITAQPPPPSGGLFVLKFLKLEFVTPAAWERTLKEGCVIYKNISGAPSKLKVTLPDNSVAEFDIPANKEVIVCGDVVHIDTRS